MNDLTEVQTEMFPKTTVAQVVYEEWLWQCRNMTPTQYNPAKAMERTAKFYDLSYELVHRIVSVQSRWIARKKLRGLAR